MVNNVLQYIYNINGSLIDQNLGSVKRLTNLVSTIQVVAPFPSTDSCIATFQYQNGDRDQIYIRITTKKGSNVVDGFQPYYQNIANYNVWEMEIPDYILGNISKFRAGKIMINYTFRELVSTVEAINYLGTFGTLTSTTQGDIPSIGTFNTGDYYVCNTYNFTSAYLDEIFTYQEAVYYTGTEWIRGTSFVQRLNTAVGIIPVDLALNGLPPQPIDPTLTEQIIDRLSFLEATYNGSLEDVEYILFDKDYVPLVKPDGMLYYDNSAGKQTLTFVNTYENGQTQEVNLGQEIYVTGKNLNGTLYEGQPVAPIGVQGNHVTYLPANASDPAKSTIVGVLTTNVASNDYGPIVVFGMIEIENFTRIMENDDDSILIPGSKLYLSATQDGKFSVIEPLRPNAAIWVATVMSINTSSHAGRIFVNPTRLRTDGGGVNIVVSNTQPENQILNDFWYDTND